MIIGVDAGCLGIKDKRLAVGVYQVAKNFLEQLGKIDKKNIYYLYSFYPIDKNIMHLFGKQMHNIIVTPTKGWIKIWLPLQIIKDNIDVFIAINQVLPTKFPWTKNYKRIAIIHDLAFEKYPHMYPDSFQKLSRESRKTAKKADILIAVSDATKKDLMNLYHTSSEKIVVVYEGVRKLPKGKKQIKQRKFFLFVGALKEQKNIPTLLKAFNIFLQKTNQKIELDIVGGNKWMDTKITKILEVLPQKTKAYIRFLDTVSDQHLADLYKSAIAFVSPSYYEGFGLPFVEAMQQSCPVIGSTAGALPEVINDAGILVDPSNENKLADAMFAVFRDKKIKTRMVEKGLERVKKYSWEMFAREIFSIIATYEK